ncbi:MAG: F0F1 ATP synthase subunit delta [Spirochaetaceae bacterium]|jgi:F0F1-type ATP synthase delta subunit|nr:F0F1 ATP synthase subunit delta [Spirochaetaceae bacterium]
MMFQVDRWTEAFIGACRKNSHAKTAEDAKDIVDGLDALKAIYAGLEKLHHVRLSGLSASRRLENALKQSLCAFAPLRETIYASRLLCLLVRHGHWEETPALIAGLELAVEKLQGVTRLRLDSAGKPDADFVEELEKNYKVSVTENPALIGGYRIIIGGRLWDYSLRGKLESMRKILNHE